MILGNPNPFHPVLNTPIPISRNYDLIVKQGYGNYPPEYEQALRNLERGIWESAKSTSPADLRAALFVKFSIMAAKSVDQRTDEELLCLLWLASEVKRNRVAVAEALQRVGNASATRYSGGLQHITHCKKPVHDLRHDFAHRVREAGSSLEEVAFILSWACHQERMNATVLLSDDVVVSLTRNSSSSACYVSMLYSLYKPVWKALRTWRSTSR